MMSKLEQSIEQLSCPLPEEAVGIGAKWRVKTRLVTTFALDQEAEYELVELVGDRGVLKITVRQSAKDQVMKLPNGPEARLVRLKSEGGGEMRFDLTRPMPESAKVEIEMDMTIAADGEQADMQMGMEMQIESE